MSRLPSISLSTLLVLAMLATGCSGSDAPAKDGPIASDGGQDQGPLPDGAQPSDGPPVETIVPGEGWAMAFGATEALRITAVAGDGAGGAVVVGSFGGTLNLGGGPLVSAGGSDIFVGAFDGSGEHRLSFRLGSDGHDEALALAVGPNGEIHIAGHFERSVSFGGASHTASAFTDAFVASFDSQGNPRWSTAFGSEWTDAIHGLAQTSAGVVATGNFGAKVQLGGGELDAVGDGDVVVALFDDSGVAQWAKSFGSRLYDSAHGVTLMGDGTIAVVGEFRESVTFGAQSLTSAGDADAFVLTLDSSGNMSWFKGLGGVGHDRGLAISATASGLAVAGGFDGAMTLGATTLSPAGQRDVFIAGLGSGGEVAWARSAGTTGDDEPTSLTTLGDALLVGGAAAGALTLGGVTLTASGKDDGFLFGLDTHGDSSWGLGLGSSEDDAVSALGQSGGLLLVGGAMGGNIDADGELLVGPAAINAFLLAYRLP